MRSFSSYSVGSTNWSCAATRGDRNRDSGLLEASGPSVSAGASPSISAAQSVIISLHVRSLSIVEAKADDRGAVRHCRLARRLESSVQHRSHAASLGDPAASVNLLKFCEV